jgi:hypothetical protein
MTSTAMRDYEYVNALAEYLIRARSRENRDIIKNEFADFLRTADHAHYITKAVLDTTDAELIRLVIDRHGSTAFGVDPKDRANISKVWKLVNFHFETSQARIRVFDLIHEVFGPPDSKTLSKYLAKSFENELPEFSAHLLKVAETIPGAADLVLDLPDIIERADERTAPSFAKFLTEADPASRVMQKLASRAANSGMVRSMAALIKVGVDIQPYLPTPIEDSGCASNQLAFALASGHQAIKLHAILPDLEDILTMPILPLRHTLGIYRAKDRKRLAKAEKRKMDEAMADIRRAERAAKRAAQAAR